MVLLVRRAADRDPHEERLIGEMLKVFAKSCLKFISCPQRAHAEVVRPGGQRTTRSSSRKDLPKANDISI